MPANNITKKYELKHLKAIQSYQKKVRKSYTRAIDKIFRSAASIKLKGDSFKLSDYPALNKTVREVLDEFHQEMTVLIVDGVKQQWGLADEKTDEIIRNHLIGREIKEQIEEVLFNRNQDALARFQERRINGLNLSDRVWNLTSQFQNEIEQGLYEGISSGKSAARMATDQKQYLLNPDKLFRRVRDAKGKLVLSQAAQKYHPGPGVYRSSFKNAFRLTRNEVNDSYRSSDMIRYQTTPFILGYEVKLSNNHPKFDICDRLAGRYPVTFIWRMWHIQCICFSVPILPDMAEYDKFEDAVLDGKGKTFAFKGAIKTVPADFRKYLSETNDQLTRLKSAPYWVKDNPKFVTLK